MIEVLIGLLGGVLVGASGAGVGLLVTPLLILVGYPPSMAITNSVGMLAIAKLVGSVIHHRFGHFPGRSAWMLAVGGAGGVFVSLYFAHAWLASGSPQVEVWLRRLVAVALLAAGLGLLKSRRGAALQNVSPTRKRSATLFMVGLGAGAPVTLTSLGSGSLLVPALALLTDWSVPQMAAASNLYGCVIGALSVVVRSRFGSFNWALFSKVLLGLLPGLGVGVYVSRRIPRQRFAQGVAVLAEFLGMGLLVK